MKFRQESDMKTLFFSAVEVIEENKVPQEEMYKAGKIQFNTSDILSPHDVLSAIKVRFVVLATY